jgi:hypothetical protein
MKASELRIGNLVKIGGEIEQLELCDFVDIHEHKTIWQYEPIPLTEEWLLKFNLNKPTNKHPYHFKKSMVEFLHSEYQNELKCFYNNVPMFSLPCTYVHQLQNLYFALTGQEL